MFDSMSVVRAWFWIEEAFGTCVVVLFGLALIALDDKKNDDL